MRRCMTFDDDTTHSLHVQRHSSSCTMQLSIDRAVLSGALNVRQEWCVLAAAEMELSPWCRVFGLLEYRYVSSVYHIRQRGILQQAFESSPIPQSFDDRFTCKHEIDCCWALLSGILFGEATTFSMLVLQLSVPAAIEVGPMSVSETRIAKRILREVLGIGEVLFVERQHSLSCHTIQSLSSQPNLTNGRYSKLFVPSCCHENIAC
jgi:hypothetical protein